MRRCTLRCQRESLPCHVIGTATSVAFDGGQSGRVERPSRGRSTRSKASDSATCSSRAGPRNMADAPAVLEGMQAIKAPPARSEGNLHNTFGQLHLVGSSSWDIPLIEESVWGIESR